ncbi:MAG: hypothetical protein IKX40_10880 [Thermoguttaceae bacterium]|nr:hypothetical protein [Thermoguttaceae bacterium]
MTLNYKFCGLKYSLFYTLIFNSVCLSFLFCTSYAESQEESPTPNAVILNYAINKGGSQQEAQFIKDYFNRLDNRLLNNQLSYSQYLGELDQWQANPLINPCAAISRNAQYVAVSRWHGDIEIYQLNGKKELVSKIKPDTSAPFDFSLPVMHFCKQDSQLAILYRKNVCEYEITVHDIKTGAKIQSIEIPKIVCNNQGKYRILKPEETVIYPNAQNKLVFQTPGEPVTGVDNETGQKFSMQVFETTELVPLQTIWRPQLTGTVFAFSDDMRYLVYAMEFKSDNLDAPTGLICLHDLSISKKDPIIIPVRQDNMTASPINNSNGLQPMVYSSYQIGTVRNPYYNSQTKEFVFTVDSKCGLAAVSLSNPEKLAFYTNSISAFNDDSFSLYPQYSAAYSQNQLLTLTSAASLSNNASGQHVFINGNTSSEVYDVANPTATAEQIYPPVDNSDRRETVEIWKYFDINGQKNIQRQGNSIVLPRNYRVSSTAFSPNSQYLAVAVQDVSKTLELGKVYIYDVKTGKALFQILPGQKKTTYHILAFTPDSEEIVVISLSYKNSICTVRHYDVKLHKILHIYKL